MLLVPKKIFFHSAPPSPLHLAHALQHIIDLDMYLALTSLHSLLATRYEELKAELEAQNPAEAAAMMSPTSIDSELAKVTVGAIKYPYELLVNGERVNGEYTSPPTFPDGIDLTQKEAYLNDEEFEEHFKMAREDFAKLPKWKQLNLKKKLKLF